WGYSSERSRRLWDEMVPVPTRKISLRLTVTYAGFEGESELLESLYKRGLQGEEIAPALYRSPGLLTFWSHDPVAPWPPPAWLEQMRQQLRPNAYLRLIENRWVTSESPFVDMALILTMRPGPVLIFSFGPTPTCFDRSSFRALKVIHFPEFLTFSRRRPGGGAGIKSWSPGFCPYVFPMYA